MTKIVDNIVYSTPYRRNWKRENVISLTENHDSFLQIQTVTEGAGIYSTGALRTLDSHIPFEQTYGRFEARIKPPVEQGHWAAFWLLTPEMGNDYDHTDGLGRDGMEIDIAEFSYQRYTQEINHGLHWDGYIDVKSSNKLIAPRIYDGEWHTFTLEWYPDRYIFYVDGFKTWEPDPYEKINGTVPDQPNVCQIPLYIKLTEEIAGCEDPLEWTKIWNHWGSGPITEASLPDKFQIDYVRVWRYQAP